jgi:hypothetical protein
MEVGSTRTLRGIIAVLLSRDPREAAVIPLEEMEEVMKKLTLTIDYDNAAKLIDLDLLRFEE